jgi:hypothetical protein
LGEEVRVITAGSVINYFVRCPRADVKKYPDEMMPLQDVLYTFVRCQLAHEAEIADNVQFLQDDAISVAGEKDRLVFGGGMLKRLLIVPEYAPENADEFPLVAHMPMDVVGWMLFGQRRGSHADYLEQRERRLTVHLAALRAAGAGR